MAVLHRFYCTCISDKAHNLRGRRWVEPASEDQVNAIPEVPAGWDGEYGNCSKISNTFHFQFSKAVWAIRAEIHKILVRIANREDPVQTASSAAF